MHPDRKKENAIQGDAKIIAIPVIAAICLELLCWEGGRRLSMNALALQGFFTLILLGASPFFLWQWWKVFSKRRWSRVLTFGCLFIIFAALVIDKPFMRGFISTIRSNVNPKQLQEWATETVIRDGHNVQTHKIAKSEYPDFLGFMKTSPYAHILCRNDHISVIWASHIGRFGLEVGPPGYTLANSGMVIGWQPGIYFVLGIM